MVWYLIIINGKKHGLNFKKATQQKHKRIYFEIFRSGFVSMKSMGANVVIDILQNIFCVCKKT